MAAPPGAVGSTPTTLTTPHPTLKIGAPMKKIALAVMMVLALASCRPDVPSPSVRYCHLTGCEVAQ